MRGWTGCWISSTTLPRGEGKEEDIELLEELGEVIKEASLCGLGGTAPNPVLSTIRYFRDEYEAHVDRQALPGRRLQGADHLHGRCRQVHRLPRLCQGMPAGCDNGEKKEVHVIDQEKCIKCGLCRDLCKFDAVLVS